MLAHTGWVVFHVSGEMSGAVKAQLEQLTFGELEKQLCEASHTSWSSIQQCLQLDQRPGSAAVLHQGLALSLGWVDFLKGSACDVEFYSLWLNILVRSSIHTWCIHDPLYMALRNPVLWHCCTMNRNWTPCPTTACNFFGHKKCQTNYLQIIF